MISLQQYPTNASVNWPVNQKIIGVLGVAPLATADFFYKLSNKKVKKDWQHPIVLIESNPKIPSRGRYLELGEANPVPFIKDSIKRLELQGADIIAIPCNTAHIFYDEYIVDTSASIPNIVKITLDMATTLANDILVLASRYIIKENLYSQTAHKNFVNCNISNYDDIDTITKIIQHVKEGEITLANRLMSSTIQEISRSVSKKTVVIMGCTELSIALDSLNNYENLIYVDSNKALADYCYNFANFTT